MGDCKFTIQHYNTQREHKKLCSLAVYSFIYPTGGGVLYFLPKAIKIHVYLFESSIVSCIKVYQKISLVAIFQRVLVSPVGHHPENAKFRSSCKQQTSLNLLHNLDKLSTAKEQERIRRKKKKDGWWFYSSSQSSYILVKGEWYENFSFGLCLGCLHFCELIKEITIFGTFRFTLSMFLKYQY